MAKMTGKARLGLIIDDPSFFGPFRTELEARFETRTVVRPSKIDRPRSVGDLIWTFEDRIGNAYHAARMRSWADVVFYEWASRILIAGSRRRGRAKVATRLHRHELWTFADRINWDNVDGVVFVCDAMRRRFMAKFPAYRGEARVIWNHVDVEKYVPPKARKTTKTLGILGSIIPRKRVYDAILAYAEARRKVPGLKLRIAGKMADAEYADGVKELIRKLDLGDDVRYEGYVEDVVEWLQGIDIILSFSLHESTHLTVFEGMATGCVPLMHFWDGASEFLPPEQIFSTEGEFVRKVADYYNQSGMERTVQARRSRSLMEERYAGKRQVKELADFLSGLTGPR